MKVKEYKIVNGNPKKDFERKIKEALAEGWQPFGGVSTLSVTAKIDSKQVIGVGFSQAMVKYE